MAHDDAEAPDDALLDPAARAEPASSSRRGPRARRAQGTAAATSGKPCLQRRDQSRCARIESGWAGEAFRAKSTCGSACDRPGRNPGRCGIPPAAARTSSAAASRRRLDLAHCLSVRLVVWRGRDEPQVVVVLALVVVVDLGEAAHQRRDSLQPRLRRHRQRRQYAGADGARARTPRPRGSLRLARDTPAGAPARRSPTHARRLGDLGERAGAQREAALELVEQPKVDAGHRPMRKARAVKKMPLGLSAGISASGAKVAVS